MPQCLRLSHMRCDTTMHVEIPHEFRGEGEGEREFEEDDHDAQ